jgi:hypothetical protein
MMRLKDQTNTQEGRMSGFDTRQMSMKDRVIDTRGLRIGGNSIHNHSSEYYRLMNAFLHVPEDFHADVGCVCVEHRETVDCDSPFLRALTKENIPLSSVYSTYSPPAS